MKSCGLAVCRPFYYDRTFKGHTRRGQTATPKQGSQFGAPGNARQQNLLKNWGGPRLRVQILYAFPAPKTGMKKSNNSMISSCASCPVLRRRLESTTLELFQRFPHCESSCSRCADSARLRQDSATQDTQTATKLW